MKVKELKEILEQLESNQELKSKIESMIPENEDEEIGTELLGRVMETIEEDIKDCEADEEYFGYVGNLLTELGKQMDGNLKEMAEEIEDGGK